MRIDSRKPKAAALSAALTVALLAGAGATDAHAATLSDTVGSTPSEATLVQPVDYRGDGYGSMQEWNASMEAKRDSLEMRAQIIMNMYGDYATDDERAVLQGCIDGASSLLTMGEVDTKSTELDELRTALENAKREALEAAAAEAEAAEAAENQVEDSNKEATMTEDEMVEAAIRAGEGAADNDFKLKFEQAQKELADVRSELDAAAEAQKAAEDKAKDATERTARLQADWENFRRRTASERIAERERATEKLVTALLPVVDDIERAIDHARSQELSDDFKQFVDGVDAVHAKLLDVFAHEGVEPIDPKGEAFDPLEHQAVGRVEDASQYDETVNDVYQKGYRMADRILRSAMVTVTYGGEKRPAPEPEAAPEDASADTAESTEE